MLRFLLLISVILIPFGIFSQSVATTTMEDQDFEPDSAVDLPFYSTSKGKIDDKTAKKLLKKGDEVYQKMWYADAAKYYEAVAKYDKSPELLQKLGNCYYFVSNLEKAHEWYHELFLSFRSTMDNQTLFRYGQSLKGVEKYNQASRVFSLIRASGDEGIENFISSKKESSDYKNITLKPLSSNSKNSDFSPIYLSKDKLVFASARDSSVFTTRKYRWNNQPYLDLYIGDIDQESDDLDNVKKLPGKINSKYHEAGGAFTPDGKTIFFTRNNFSKRLKRDEKGVSHLTLYVSNLVGGEWSKPVSLPFNNDNYSTGHPALSPDGSKLYFASDMPGGYGETDIYVVDINDDGTYSEPKNLGRSINSKEKEMFPFVTDDNIYFSSNRKLGFGGLDVYKSTYASTTYQVAVNLGAPINSNADDFSYIVDEESNKGYFASNRKGGEGDDDLYAFKYIVVDENNSSLLIGVVIEERSGGTIPNTPVSLLDEEGNLLKEVITDDFGSFEFNDLTTNTKYELRTEKEGYQKEIKIVNTQDLAELTVNLILRDNQSSVVVDGNTHMLETSVVYFDFDRYALRQEAKTELKEIIKVWERFPNMIIKIESHTDSRGSKIYNRILSQKRADATKSFLLEMGLQPSHIESAIGYGEDRISDNCGDECADRQHQKNRRSDLIVTEH